jgi:hypothetical protein
MYTARGLAGERKQSVGSEPRDDSDSDGLSVSGVFKLSKLKRRRDL